ncbi:hypothetical protein [Streptomyces sp. JNUCC 63]
MVDDEALVRTGFTALLNTADDIEVTAGFLLEDNDPEQLPHLVRALAEGGPVLSSKVIGTTSSPQRNRRCRRR